MKQWVLVTGASQGIGYELSRLFASKGFNLVLVARDEARLTEISRELSSQHCVTVKVLAKDLARMESAQEIFDTLQREQIFVSVLVNNAGFGVHGRIAGVELRRHLDLIQVNVTSLVQLTHLFVQPMIARGEGRILNVASIASFISGPFAGMYYASKAFVHSFSTALATELKGSGVTVTTLYPGLTRSKFHERAGVKSPSAAFTMEADVVARAGYDAMMAGRPLCVPGLMNKLIVCMARMMPIRLMMWAVGRTNRKRLGGGEK
jgi:short-subunit dehydrogenase